MKKGSRKAVAYKGNMISAICIFRGDFLEKIFIDEKLEKVKDKFYASSIIGEVREISDDKEKEEYCKTIIEKIERKLNKLLST